MDIISIQDIEERKKELTTKFQDLFECYKQMALQGIEENFQAYEETGDTYFQGLGQHAIERLKDLGRNCAMDLFQHEQTKDDAHKVDELLLAEAVRNIYDIDGIEHKYKVDPSNFKDGKLLKPVAEIFQEQDHDLKQSFDSIKTRNIMNVLNPEPEPKPIYKQSAQERWAEKPQQLPDDPKSTKITNRYKR